MSVGQNEGTRRTNARRASHAFPGPWALADDGRLMQHPYFEEIDPYVEDSESTYTDARRAIVNRRSYEWNHGIGETVNALLDHGLQLDSLVEHDWTDSPGLSFLVAADDERWTTPPGTPRLPLSFTMLAHRPLHIEAR